MYNFDYWTRLKKLGIMSLQRRRERHIIILVWKIKNNIIPNDINLEFGSNKYSSNVKAILKPQPKVQGKLLSTFENSFVIKCSKLWNKLPTQLTEILVFSLFERRLDRYLSFIPDNPPVHGYPHTNNNSILNLKTINYEIVIGK